MTDIASPGPSGLASRKAALAAVEAGLSRRGGPDEVFAGPDFARLEPRDRAFARRLALTALRRHGAIESLLAPRLQKPPPDAVKALLRLGLTQARWMDVPDHAAVASTLDLAEASKATVRFKPLLNGVLRGLLRNGAADPAPEANVPAWLFARWRAAYGPKDAEAIAALVPAEPATDLSPKDPAQAEAIAAVVEGHMLPGGSVRTERRGDLAAWPGFEDGTWWVQDAAAAIPARLLAVKAGESALDLCAAPGGKTLQLAAAGARVTALDRSAARLQRLSANLERIGLAAEIVAAEAGAWADERTFDAVLLDAPCSATGTFRRHPDVLWASRATDIAKLAEVQRRLLQSAAKRVAPGGRLVYCVCSLEPEEGETQVAAFLKTHPAFRLDPIQPGEGGLPEASLKDGMARILPHHMPGGCDGFFAARMVRAE